MNVQDSNIQYLADVVEKFEQYWEDLTLDQVVRIDSVLANLENMIEDRMAEATEAKTEEVDIQPKF